MGSAALYPLAKRGCKVLGIDQFSPPHALGSSHGDTRITRQAIGEGEHYTPLALRSYELWREIEQQTGETLLEITGGLIISSNATVSSMHVPEFLANTLAAAKTYDIGHEIFDAAEIRRKFPQFHVEDGEYGYYEYDAGFLRPERCIGAQIALAKQFGAIVHCNEKVETFHETTGIVSVRTSLGEYEADRLIVTAGAWLPKLISDDIGGLFKIIRQVLVWFDVMTPIERFQPSHFPIFIWALPGKTQGIYGFPAIDGRNGGVKIATEQYASMTTADSADRSVTPEEIQAIYEDYVAPYFPDLSRTCVKAATCLYTLTPDSHFVIDSHPEYPSVILASPCSGHGFKHSAAIGEVLAQLALDGVSAIDISRFKFSRFQTRADIPVR
jgi:sarcosine oxidase